jgi:hypothetical protein
VRVFPDHPQDVRDGDQAEEDAGRHYIYFHGISVGRAIIISGPSGRRIPGLPRERPMKKQESKKLTLTRETLRTLEGIEPGQIAGGLADNPGKVSSDNRACTFSRTCE